MQPWFIATERCTSQDPAWEGYVAWSGLSQLDEVVSLDHLLCPTILPTIEEHYWPYVVAADYMGHFFVDLEFLLKQIPERREVNLLCVYYKPQASPPPYCGRVKFEFLGYDLVEVNGGGISALTNCGGFPDVFANSELSSKGLLTSHERAWRVQADLLAKHPEEPHADCDVWAISRAVGV
jgi:hypothetical protein